MRRGRGLAAVLCCLCYLGTLPHRVWATNLETAGVRDTFTQLQQDQLVAVATDGLDKRDRTEQQQVVAEVTNLMAAQVAETVKKAEEVQTQAAVDVVASALAGTQAAAVLAADAAAAGVGVGQGFGFVGGADAGAFGAAGGFAGGAGVAGMGAGLGVGPGFTVLDKKVLAYMMDKDPDRYDDYLALQHNKSTEIAGHKVVVPVEEDSETNFPLRFSAHKCTGIQFEHRVCHFHNVILWNGTFLYITEGHEPLPEVQLTYIGIDPFRSITNLTDAMNATDPGLMPFDWGTTPKIVVDDALIFYMSYHNNYGHLMGETAPLMHSLLCTYFGRCTYSEEDRTGLQILLYNKQPNVTTIMPRAIREELWPCFTKFPLLRMNDGSMRGKAMLIKHLVAGVGPSCRGFPWCRARFMRVGPAPIMMTSWKERVHKCVGLPLGTTANLERPNLVIINRPLQHGRGFINAQEVAHQLENDFKQLTVHVEELNEESLSSQATKYFRTDILVQMHGAALGNVVFLPKGAIYIDVVPENNEDKHTWAFFMGKDLMPLQINPIAFPAQKVELMMSVIQNMPEWKLLTEDQKELILKHHKCPPQNELPFSDQTCFIEWFMKRSNSYLNYTQLKSTVDLALQGLENWSYKRDPNYVTTALDLTDMRPDRELYDLV